jgi:hypothetical protein
MLTPGRFVFMFAAFGSFDDYQKLAIFNDPTKVNRNCGNYWKIILK